MSKLRQDYYSLGTTEEVPIRYPLNNRYQRYAFYIEKDVEE